MTQEAAAKTNGNNFFRFLYPNIKYNMPSSAQENNIKEASPDMNNVMLQ